MKSLLMIAIMLYDEGGKVGYLAFHLRNAIGSLHGVSCFIKFDVCLIKVGSACTCDGEMKYELNIARIYYTPFASFPTHAWRFLFIVKCLYFIPYFLNHIFCP